MRSLAAALLALCLSACTSVFFQPQAALVMSPEQFGLDYEPVKLRAADGIELLAWFFPAHGSAQGTVLYLHGNGENISTQFGNVAWLPAAGFNVLALDYRGYGASEGTPSLSGAQLDIDAAMRELFARPDVDPERIVVFGQSLGAALAVHYVAHSPYRAKLRGVILDSPFSDYRLIAREKIASFPLTWPLQWVANWIIGNDFSPEASIRAVSPVPVLFIHGDHDFIVPLHHSQRLYERAGEPKELWVVPNAGHIQAIWHAAARKKLAQFLHDCVHGQRMVRAD